MLNDGVPPAPPGRELLGVSGKSQRLLVHFELVMGEHSVCDQELDKVSDKVSDKERQKTQKGLREGKGAVPSRNFVSMAVLTLFPYLNV